ncbi:MAG: hypothetical protein H7141_06325 [Burkholderiales bacterium]|nr:hypothetical protein [Bacteroidia bacterium]
MNKLNYFIVLFCVSFFSTYSQIGIGGFKINPFDGKPMPSVLLSFDAIIADKKVELTWSSDTENNNNFFTIEKSKDAVAFEIVATIKGFGNYSNLISYFDVDYTPYDGISFYRLKQTDSKGTVLSSRLVSVNNKFGNTNYASNISISEDQSGLLGSENREVLVVLRNEKGLESYSKVIIDEDRNVIIPSDSDYKLDNGTYIVVASSDNKLYSQKVFVK